MTTARYGGRLSALHTGRLYLIFTTGWVDPRAMVWSEENMSLKNPVTTPGIDPGTVRLVTQRLNHYANPGCVIKCAVDNIDVEYECPLKGISCISQVPDPVWISRKRRHNLQCPLDTHLNKGFCFHDERRTENREILCNKLETKGIRNQILIVIIFSVCCSCVTLI